MTFSSPLKAACGSWKSPLTADCLFSDVVRWDHVFFDSVSSYQDIYWCESRPSEKGRSVICSQVQNGEVSTWTIPGHNCRTLVHEYGGVSYLVHDRVLYYVNLEDQRIYKQHSSKGSPTPVTSANPHHRFADFVYHPQKRTLYSVFEDHSPEKKKNGHAVNHLVSIHVDTGELTALVTNCDFVASPKLSPSGKQLAWIQWDFPNMPWDDTQLYMATLEPSGNGIIADSVTLLVDGSHESVLYPVWSPFNELYYISDRSGWWNLYRIDQNGSHVSILQKPAEFCRAMWILGGSYYCFHPISGDLVASYKTKVGWKLLYLSRDGNSVKEISTDLTEFSCLKISSTNILYFIGASSSVSKQIMAIDLLNHKESIIRSNSSSGHSFDGFLSFPDAIQFKTTDGHHAFGYFYPPHNRDFAPLDHELPPLLVRAHGGPTSECSHTLSYGIQYFTSRGFAVLDVNYRGSTGYGRSFRDLLYGKWGIYDVEDCCHGALHLSNLGKVDINRVVIDGSSAGGYTTLAALTFHDTFKAGASIYGIGDLKILATDTHKFESKYLRQLISPDPNSPDYYNRSPINFVDKISCPIVIFQGSEDKVVPPNQAERMYNAVQKKRLPVALKIYEGEQHGWRKKETMKACIEGELYFFLKVFGIESTENLIQVKISNLAS